MVVHCHGSANVQPGGPFLQSDSFDILIIGAGISGIGVACRLARRFPDRRIGIIERRKAIGGTWDLHRYPGIRSDSDMYTMGYRFAPWSGGPPIADGASIRAYIENTARATGPKGGTGFGARLLARAVQILVS